MQGTTIKCIIMEAISAALFERIILRKMPKRIELITLTAHPIISIYTDVKMTIPLCFSFKDLTLS